MLGKACLYRLYAEIKLTRVDVMVSFTCPLGQATTPSYSNPNVGAAVEKVFCKCH